MRCLAQTQGPKVRVNAVLPGLLLTEWVQHNVASGAPESSSADVLKGAQFSEARIKQIEDKAALKQVVYD